MPNTFLLQDRRMCDYIFSSKNNCCSLFIYMILQEIEGKIRALTR